MAVAEPGWGLPVTQYVLGAGAPQEAGALPQAPQQAAALQAVSARVHNILALHPLCASRALSRISEDGNI